MFSTPTRRTGRSRRADGLRDRRRRAASCRSRGTRRPAQRRSTGAAPRYGVGIAGTHGFVARGRRRVRPRPLHVIAADQLLRRGRDVLAHVAELAAWGKAPDQVIVVGLLVRARGERERIARGFDELVARHDRPSRRAAGCTAASTRRLNFVAVLLVHAFIVIAAERRAAVAERCRQRNAGGQEHREDRVARPAAGQPACAPSRCQPASHALSASSWWAAVSVVTIRRRDRQAADAVLARGRGPVCRADEAWRYGSTGPASQESF